MCRLALNPTSVALPARPDWVNECGRCALAIGRARKKAHKAATARPRRALAAADAAAVDRRDRARTRGTSIRAVRGGLPGLGRR